jgi:hypothetical protein
VSSTQVHDFNPGIAPNGVFWTVAVPASAVDVDLDAGTARLQVTNLALKDYFTIANSLFGGGPSPINATVSFDVIWGGVTARAKIRDAAKGFAGEFAHTGATIAWSASESGFSFASNASGQAVAFAEIGHERNGVFFAEAR